MQNFCLVSMSDQVLNIRSKLDLLLGASQHFYEDPRTLTVFSSLSFLYQPYITTHCSITAFKSNCCFSQNKRRPTCAQITYKMDVDEKSTIQPNVIQSNVDIRYAVFYYYYYYYLLDNFDQEVYHDSCSVQPDALKGLTGWDVVSCCKNPCQF